MTDEFTRMLQSAPQQPPPRPSTSAVRVTFAATLLLAYAVIVLVMTMWPTPITKGREAAVDKVITVVHRSDMFEWFGYSAFEFLANVALFIPLGFLVGLAFARRFIWVGLLLLPAFSAGIEVTQRLLISDRYGTMQDIVANSIGGWIGLLLAFLLRAVVHARDKKVIAQAQWDRDWGQTR